MKMLCVGKNRFRPYGSWVGALAVVCMAASSAELAGASSPDALIAEMEQAALEMESKPRGEPGRTARVKEIWGRIEALGEEAVPAIEGRLAQKENRGSERTLPFVWARSRANAPTDSLYNCSVSTTTGSSVAPR